MSKFLRQMTALSKKPTDFAVEESVPPIKSVPHTVSIPPTDTKNRPARHPQPRRAYLAQDGHSHAEQAVYAALWEAGAPETGGDRIVTMGLGRLSKAARLSENNCRLNIRSLVQKLALEEIGAENSRAGIGKTYRVYSYVTILTRRRAAGLEWVVRTKGVKFVDQSIKSVPPTESVSPTAPRGGAPTESGGGPPTDSVPPYRNLFRNNSKEASSSEHATLLIERLASLGIHLDDDAGRHIISRCQNSDHTATVEEITVFAELKVRQLVKRRNVENWPGLLMASVPAYFDPPATDLSRYRAERRLEQEKERHIAREILENEQSTSEERAWAHSVLKAYVAFTCNE